MDLFTAEAALEAIEAAEKKAKELGISITTVVVDSHGVVVALKRMKDALVISPRFAYSKAYTAATLKVPTSSISGYVVPEKPYYGLTSLFGGKLTVIAGGIPIVDGDEVLGAVGVGGAADVSQDEDCAKVAAQHLSK